MILKQKKLICSKKLQEDLYKKIKTSIDEAYEKVKEKVTIISNITEFEFLDSKYTLDDLITNALDNVRNEIKKEIYDKIEEIYNIYLQKLIDIIKNNLDTRYKNLMEILQGQYNSTYNKYINNSQVSNYIIKELDKEFLVPEINDVFDKLITEAEKIYNQTTIGKSLDDLQIEQLKNLNIHSESETIIQQISVKLNNFIEKAQMRLSQEKLWI